MKRNYKIINLHLSWGAESDNSIGHALVVGRLASTSYYNGTTEIPPFADYEDYLSACHKHGIYSANEQRFNEYFNPQQ